MSAHVATQPSAPINSRRLIVAPEARHLMVANCDIAREGSALRMTNVRFGSKADMCAATSDVCFTPDSDHESGHVPMVMSALPPKADMCSAARDVRYGRIADIQRSPSRLAWTARLGCLHPRLKLTFAREFTCLPGTPWLLGSPAVQC